jgi:hypothetical protein
MSFYPYSEKNMGDIFKKMEPPNFSRLGPNFVCQATLIPSRSVLRLVLKNYELRRTRERTLTKVGRSVIETFFYIFRKLASLGQAESRQTSCDAKLPCDAKPPCDFALILRERVNYLGERKLK